MGVKPGLLDCGKHRLSVFENSVLFKLFGHKMEKVTEEGRDYVTNICTEGYWGDKINNEGSITCDIYEMREKYVPSFVSDA